MSDEQTNDKIPTKKPKTKALSESYIVQDVNDLDVVKARAKELLEAHEVKAAVMTFKITVDVSE